MLFRSERVKAPVGLGSRLGFRSTKSEWFRVYRDFFLPSDSFDVIFLKARIAIFCAKGFEIMDLHEYVCLPRSRNYILTCVFLFRFKSITIPFCEDPHYSHLSKRWDSVRPLGMFKSTDEEFLLCYDGIFYSSFLLTASF